MSKVRRALLLQLLSLALGAAVIVYLARTYPLVSYVVSAQNWVASLGLIAGLLYPLLYAGCNVLLLPAGVLAVGSGLFFGLWGGFASNLAGYTVGALIAIVVGRKVAREWLRRKLLQNRKWAELDEAVGREGWKIVFLAQVMPFAPSSLLNYLFGVTRIPLGKGLLWSVIGQAPAMFIYAYFGTLTKMGLRILHGDRQPPVSQTVMWIGGLIVTIVAAALLARLAARLLREAEARAAQALDTQAQALKAQVPPASSPLPKPFPAPAANHILAEQAF